MPSFTATKADHGQRLDRYLRAQMPQYSRSFLQRLPVLVNGRPGKPSYRLRAGDRVSVEIPPPAISRANPPDVRRISLARDWLPLTGRGTGETEWPTGEAFRPEWIDFQRGIRVGNLQPHERITQILKFHLEQRYRTPFVTDRWGRGVFWQWICWLPRANREAKPVSHDVNFGCAKLFISVEQERKVFKCGLQIERGYARGPEPYPGCRLKPDWDWHRLMKPSDRLDAELRRLIQREGFVAEVGDWEDNAVFTKKNFRSARQIRAAAGRYPTREWVGFQVYYPMPEREVRGCTGYELVKAMTGIFGEVVPAMNACMDVELQPVSAADVTLRRPGGTGR